MTPSLNGSHYPRLRTPEATTPPPPSDHGDRAPAHSQLAGRVTGDHAVPPDRPSDRDQRSNPAPAPPTPARHRPGRPNAAGEGVTADLVAPAALEQHRTHLRLDDEVVRVLALTRYPRTVHPGWLERLFEVDAPLDLSLHLTPLDSAAAVRRLTHRLVELQSSRLFDARGGRIERAERTVVYEDVDRLRDALQRGEERVFATALYLLLRHRTAAGLDTTTDRVETALGSLLAGSHPATFAHLPGLRSCLPAGRDELGRTRTLDTTSLATMLPFAAGHGPSAGGILAGVGLHSRSLVVTDPFAPEFDNANKVVFATSGAGKSYACKVEALRALVRGIDYLVIDPEDEYRRLCLAVDGQQVRLAGGSPHHLNPFDLPPPATTAGDAPPPMTAVGRSAATDGGRPRSGSGDRSRVAAADPPRDLLAEQILSLHGLLGLMLAEPGGVLTQGEKGALDTALYQTYHRAGISPDPRTHHRRPPVLADLHAVLSAHGDPQGLATRLARFVTGSLGRIFSAPTSVDLRRPMVVFSVRDLAPELRPLGVYLITDYLWREVRRQHAPRMLLIDEAWQLVQHVEGARFLASVARQARKHYLGLTTITQDVADFLGTPEGHTVLANASTQLLLRQDASTIDLVCDTFKLSAGERAFLLGCGKGEGLLIRQGLPVALQVVASPAEHALATTDPAELAAFTAQGSHAPGMSVAPPSPRADTGGKEDWR